MTNPRRTGQIELAVVYVLRDPRCRPAFLALMSELRSVTTRLMTLAGPSAGYHTLMERDDREGWFIEILGFANEKERTRFDDLYCRDRKAAAIQCLIEELVDAANSDYVVTRGSGESRASLAAYLHRACDRAAAEVARLP